MFTANRGHYVQDMLYMSNPYCACSLRLGMLEMSFANEAWISSLPRLAHSLLFSLLRQSDEKCCSKRTIFFQIWQIFDPLGLGAALVTKLLMQILSLLKISWDKSLPWQLCNQWRHISTHENPANLISRGLLPNQLIYSHGI